MVEKYFPFQFQFRTDLHQTFMVLKLLVHHLLLSVLSISRASVYGFILFDVVVVVVLILVLVVDIHFICLLWFNVFFFSHWITYLDWALFEQPGAFFHSLSNMPTYSNDIRNSGITYDDKKNETCWMGRKFKWVEMLYHFALHKNKMGKACASIHVSLSTSLFWADTGLSISCSMNGMYSVVVINSRISYGIFDRKQREN